MKLALVSYSGLFILQLAAYFVTNFLVLLAQSLEVLSDVVVSAFLLLSISWSSKPPDEYHMFGHGRAQNVAALVAGVTMILFMSITVFEEAVAKFFAPSKTGQAVGVNLAIMVLLVSMLVLAVPLIEVMRVKEKSASVKAQWVQILKDEIAYVPALTGVILVGRGYAVGDPIASIMIGGVILFGGVYLFRSNVEYLVGRSPGPEYLERITTAAMEVKGVLEVHDLRAEYVGPGIVHAGFHIQVAKGTAIEDVDEIVREVRGRVGQVARCHDCVIQVDPSE